MKFREAMKTAASSAVSHWMVNISATLLQGIVFTGYVYVVLLIALITITHFGHLTLVTTASVVEQNERLQKLDREVNVLIDENTWYKQQYNTLTSVNNAQGVAIDKNKDSLSDLYNSQSKMWQAIRTSENAVRAWEAKRVIEGK